MKILLKTDLGKMSGEGSPLMCHFSVMYALTIFIILVGI